MFWLAALAATPLLLIVVLLLVFKRPLYLAAPITLVYTGVLAWYAWAESTQYLQAAGMKGALIAADILLIIFGAILFLRFLQGTKILDDLEAFLCSISPDQRIQVIFLAWFFLSFVEGTSGFGTPMAIVAPILVGLGFPAITAVAVSLVAVGTSVAFGAVGTPIRVGLAGLPADMVPFYAGLINMIVGALMPILILWTLLRLSEKKQPGALREIVPYALMAGACLTVPYFLATFIGQEFPSLIGPAVGLLIIIPLTRAGVLVPKNTWRLTEKKTESRQISVVRTITPYAFFIALLLAGKLFLDGKWTWTLAPQVNGSFAYFNPGYAFALTVLLAALLFKTGVEPLQHAFTSALKVFWKPFIVIFCISTFVQIMILSNYNSSGMPGMLELLGGFLVTPLLPFLAPFVGMFGAFISGSATVSNLLFGHFQYKAAVGLGIDSQPVLALQTIGGGVGNTVSLTDITAVEATVGLHNEERTLLHAVWMPVFLYLALAGIIGMIIVYFF